MELQLESECGMDGMVTCLETRDHILNDPQCHLRLVLHRRLESSSEENTEVKNVGLVFKAGNVMQRIV